MPHRKPEFVIAVRYNTDYQSLNSGPRGSAIKAMIRLVYPDLTTVIRFLVPLGPHTRLGVAGKSGSTEFSRSIEPTKYSRVAMHLRIL